MPGALVSQAKLSVLWLAWFYCFHLSVEIWLHSLKHSLCCRRGNVFLPQTLQILLNVLFAKPKPPAHNGSCKMFLENQMSHLINRFHLVGFHSLKTYSPQPLDGTAPMCRVLRMGGEVLVCYRRRANEMTPFTCPWFKPFHDSFRKLCL